MHRRCYVLQSRIYRTRTRLAGMMRRLNPSTKAFYLECWNMPWQHEWEIWTSLRTLPVTESYYNRTTCFTVFSYTPKHCAYHPCGLVRLPRQHKES